MLRRAWVALGVAAILAVGGARAGSSQETRLLAGGPVLAGQHVIWGEWTSNAVRVRSVDGRVLYERSVAAGDSVQLQELAASPLLVAAREELTHCPTPRPAPTGGIVSPCSVSRRVVFGPPAGPFARSVHERTCAGGTLSVSDSLDVSGRVLVASTTYDAFCDPAARHLRRRVLVRGATTAQLIDADASAKAAPGDVRAAGRFVAWSELGGRGIVVYDRTRRAPVYRATVTEARNVGSLGFDVQADGKLAVAYHLVSSDPTGDSLVSWWSPAEPRAHRSPLHAGSTRIRIARDRIVFVGAGERTLVLWPLGGRPVTLARLVRPVGGLDFDGRGATWATVRISSSRLDCPPQGIGAPCLRRFTGVTTLWLLRLGARPHAVAELPFADSPLPG